MADADVSTLGALTAPHSAIEFLRDYWPDKPFVAHGDPARLPAFLRAPELASIEALSRVYRGNLRFTSGRRYQKMLAIDQVQATSLYRMGLTVQFEDIAASVAATAPGLRRLEAELGVARGAARASVFSSPLSDGLSVHFDAQDLFSIQLKGTKSFRIAPVRELRYPCGTQFVPDTEPFDFLYPQVAGGFPDPASAEFTTVEMQPGSVLFLPRGTWHATESGGDSLSVSIGIYLPSAADCVLEQLQLLLLQDPDWRRPLYGGWGEGAVRDAVATRLSQLLARLPHDCAGLRVEDIVSGLRLPEERLAAIALESRFQKTPHSRLEVEAGPAARGYAHDVLRVMISDPNYGERMSTRMEVAPEAAAVFRWIADSRAAFSAGALAERFPMFPFAQHRQMLEAAARSGLIRMLWFPPLAPTSPEESA
ncbi:MAG TPA: cupin domain-containing protein [Casimicrobiaceae bacterium]